MFTFLVIVCILLLTALEPGHADEAWFVPLIVTYAITCAGSAAAFISLCGFQTYLQWAWGMGTMDWMTKRHQAAVLQRREARQAAAAAGTAAPAPGTNTPHSTTSATANAVDGVSSHSRVRTGATAPYSAAFEFAAASGDTEASQVEDAADTTHTAPARKLDCSDNTSGGGLHNDSEQHVETVGRGAAEEGGGAAEEGVHEAEIVAFVDDAEACTLSGESSGGDTDVVALPNHSAALGDAGQGGANPRRGGGCDEDTPVVRSREMSAPQHETRACESNGAPQEGDGCQSRAPPITLQSTVSCHVDTPLHGEAEEIGSAP